MYHTNLVGGILCATLLDLSGLLERPPVTERVNIPRTFRADIERCVRLGARYCEIGYDDLPKAAPRRGGPRSSRDIIDRCLVANDVERKAKPLWEELAISDRHRDSAASIMLEALAIRCAREYDLPGLCRCLEDMACLSEPPSLTLQEATQFMLNQQVESGAIGVDRAGEERDDPPSARKATLALVSSLACVLSALPEPGE